MRDPDFDRQARFAAFTFLTALEERAGTRSLRYADLRAFEFQGIPIPLVDRQRGIRNPRPMVATLSFKTTAGEEADRREYADGIGDDGFLRYSWQAGYGADTTNAAVRRAWTLGLPLVWFSGTGSGTYEAIRPVYVVAEDATTRQFVIAFGDLHRTTWPVRSAGEAEVSRRYVNRLVRQRLHQAAFRTMVIAAYRERCAVCGLGCAPLLDAAHIAPDHEGGRAAVTNGLALCKLHHAAFDNDLIGIDPTYTIHLHRSFRESTDVMVGATMQRMQGRILQGPRQKREWPDRDLLTVRFERFQSAP